MTVTIGCLLACGGFKIVVHRKCLIKMSIDSLVSGQIMTCGCKGRCESYYCDYTRYRLSMCLATIQTEDCNKEWVKQIKNKELKLALKCMVYLSSFSTDILSYIPDFITNSHGSQVHKSIVQLRKKERLLLSKRCKIHKINCKSSF